MLTCALILSSEFLASQNTHIAGKPVLDYVADVCRQAGLSPVFSPKEVTPPHVVIDGRFAGLREETLRALQEGSALSLGTEDGTIIASLIGKNASNTGDLKAHPSKHHTVHITESCAIMNPWDLEKVAQVVMGRRMEALALEGVEFIRPESIRLDLSVTIESGCTVGPNVILKGNTHLAEGVLVECGSVLEDTSVGPHTQIRPYSVCSQAKIGEYCHIGPMAHLRPGTILHDRVKVGNFVETKASTLHSDVKASHLSYLGNATIGAQTNVGAGTITCNYDGVAKHETTIGPNSFIGSNTSLIAPVAVGEQVIIGAGSVVDQDVEDRALALSRPSLKILPNKAPTLQKHFNKRSKDSTDDPTK